MNVNNHETLPDEHQDKYTKTIFGFWLYLLTDFVLFSTVMATYVVLRKSTFGGPSASQLLPLPFVLMQTFLLLICAFTSGLAGVFVHRGKKHWTSLFFALTFLFGLLFMAMEFSGFQSLVQQGYGWGRSAFLSAYFTLLGMHALHMVFALLWIIVLLPPVWRHGITDASKLRLTALRMFWQFLNIIWIGLFTLIYLMGID